MTHIHFNRWRNLRILIESIMISSEEYNGVVWKEQLPYYSPASQIPADLGAHFVETLAGFQQTCLFSRYMHGLWAYWHHRHSYTLTTRWHSVQCTYYQNWELWSFRCCVVRILWSIWKRFEEFSFTDADWKWSPIKWLIFFTFSPGFLSSFVWYHASHANIIYHS